MAMPLGSAAAEQIAYFEQLGANQVRLLLDSGSAEIPFTFRPAAIRWLAQQDKDALARERDARQTC
jgi:hypothetical protein